MHRLILEALFFVSFGTIISGVDAAFGIIIMLVCLVCFAFIDILEDRY